MGDATGFACGGVSDAFCKDAHCNTGYVTRCGRAWSVDQCPHIAKRASLEGKVLFKQISVHRSRCEAKGAAHAVHVDIPFFNGRNLIILYVQCLFLRFGGACS